MRSPSALSERNNHPSHAGQKGKGVNGRNAISAHHSYARSARSKPRTPGLPVPAWGLHKQLRTASVGSRPVYTACRVRC